MEWVRGATIGHGNFATVNLAVSHGGGHHTVIAVKSCITASAAANATLMNEKEVLTQLTPSTCVVRLLGEGHSIENGRELYNLFLEYAAGGNLADKITSSPCGLPEADVRRYTRAVVEALRHIHSCGFAHCDVKPRNVLLFPSAGFCGADQAKVADFGLAKRWGEIGGGLKGTPMYMSPEVVAGEVGERPADIWALGCTVVEMASGVPAWGSSADEGAVSRLLLRIGAGEETPLIPARLSEEGKDFLGKCLVRDPSRRWTAEMLLGHPFVSSVALESSSNSEKNNEASSSSSPRAPFDFPPPSLESSLCSPGTADLVDSAVSAGKCRIQELASAGGHGDSWSASSDSCWILVR